jgi:hypothetical protein
VMGLGARNRTFEERVDNALEASFDNAPVCG